MLVFALAMFGVLLAREWGISGQSNRTSLTGLTEARATRCHAGVRAPQCPKQFHISSYLQLEDHHTQEFDVELCELEVVSISSLSRLQVSHLITPSGKELVSPEFVSVYTPSQVDIAPYCREMRLYVVKYYFLGRRLAPRPDRFALQQSQRDTVSRQNHYYNGSH